jgi:hypothetical protein
MSSDPRALQPTASGFEVRPGLYRPVPRRPRPNRIGVLHVLHALQELVGRCNRQEVQPPEGVASAFRSVRCFTHIFGDDNLYVSCAEAMPWPCGRSLPPMPLHARTCIHWGLTFQGAPMRQPLPSACPLRYAPACHARERRTCGCCARWMCWWACMVGGRCRLGGGAALLVC